jgi:hypothetical protein
VPEEEIKIISRVLSSALPGLEQFVTEERHATLLGKMAYNSYGVCFDGGRDDKVHLHFEIVRRSCSFSNCSPCPRNDRKMSKRHGHPTGLRSKSAAVYILFQHMNVFFARAIVPSDTVFLRLPIRALHPPALLSAAEHPNSTSSPIALSRKATKSLYPTSTPPDTLTRLPLTPGGAGAWN